MIQAVNASGLSAFNPVERRLAPISAGFSGVCLPHDTHGNHLDANGNTIDSDLEKKNFDSAGDICAEICSNITINGYKVDGKRMPVGSEFVPEEVGPNVSTTPLR